MAKKKGNNKKEMKKKVEEALESLGIDKDIISETRKTETGIYNLVVAFSEKMKDMEEKTKVQEITDRQGEEIIKFVQVSKLQEKILNTLQITGKIRFSELAEEIDIPRNHLGNELIKLIDKGLVKRDHVSQIESWYSLA